MQSAFDRFHDGTASAADLAEVRKCELSCLSTQPVPTRRCGGKAAEHVRPRSAATQVQRVVNTRQMWVATAVN